jgi:hypothetical protein
MVVWVNILIEVYLWPKTHKIYKTEFHISTEINKFIRSESAFKGSFNESEILEQSRMFVDRVNSDRINDDKIEKVSFNVSDI